jgi:hypothetical protein
MMENEIIFRLSLVGICLLAFLTASFILVIKALNVIDKLREHFKRSREDNDALEDLRNLYAREFIQMNKRFDAIMARERNILTALGVDYKKQENVPRGKNKRQPRRQYDRSNYENT